MASNWLDALKDALQGAAGGAAAGAGIGSFSANPAGTALGAGIGGAGGAFLSLLSKLGGNGDIQQLENLSPEQQSILQFLLEHGKNSFENPYEGFEGIANQARSDFNQNTVPGLAERFTSLGNNSLGSPAFVSQLGQAGAGLDTNLAALKSHYGMQNKQTALQSLGLGLKPSFENYYQPGTGSSLFSGALKAAPKFLEAYNKK